MQNAQRLAARGIALRHSGHARTSSAGSFCSRAVSALTGFTTKKKTAAAVSNSDGAKPERGEQPEEQPDEPGDWDYVPMSEWGDDVGA